MSRREPVTVDFKYWRKRLSYSLNRLSTHLDRPINVVGSILDVVAGLASVICLIALTIFIGYNLEQGDVARLLFVLRCCQGIFAVNILYHLILRFRDTVKQSRIIKWIVDVAILISLLPWIYPKPDNAWLPQLAEFLYSLKFLFCVLGAYSLIDICYALSRLTGRRTNPSLIMAFSFLFFIAIGSLVLMLPKCTYHGISYFDSLFVSSSAVCITGLTSVDIPSTFTPRGILVLSILIQLGGLGVITFTSFFAMFFTGNTSIYNQLLLRDMLYSKSMNALIPTLLYVLGFTITVELIGAVAVYFTIPAGLGLDVEQKLMFAAFHSLSSFCNAGFSCLPQGLSNPVLMESTQTIYIITSILIFAGAIGFPILVNFKEILKHYLVKLWNRIRRVHVDLMPVHIFDVNTKLVLYTTLSILIFSSIAFFLLEYNNTLAGMSIYEKIVQSVFNSLTPRSAGFSSVNPANFLNVTLLLVMVQMIIGGASQSLAGGIKVNTIGAVLLSLRSVLYGHTGTSAFGRTINPVSIRRAHAVLALGLISMVVYSVTILILEPQLSAKSAIFEVISALFTVGSSLGATPELSDASKMVLCSAMFVGRVGIISLLCGIIGSKPDISPHLPTDNIIIN